MSVSFAGLHGGGCKVPSNVLNKLLEELGGTNVLQDEQFFSGMILPRLGKIATKKYLLCGQIPLAVFGS